MKYIPTLLIFSQTEPLGLKLLLDIFQCNYRWVKECAY